MNNKKNKKKLLVVLGISAFTILGGTLAYFTTSDNIINNFKTALYQHSIVEKFESPSDWTPGTTTEKTIEVTNTGSIGMALRASYTEKWVNTNGKEISLIDTNNNRASIINFGDGWQKADDGYYYYGSKENLTKLNSNETSSSFIKSVTFNENIVADLEKDVSSDGQTITYTSSGKGYDNAKYILTITIDTIQYDQANNIW
ncbi:MAG: BsaA family SipW-dependent biofilm matrix protein [Bacilli bacterium]